MRATEIDKVQTQACFRPGDIVRAVVISLGDARSYYLRWGSGATAPGPCCTAGVAGMSCLSADEHLLPIAQPCA